MFYQEPQYPNSSIIDLVCVHVCVAHKFIFFKVHCTICLVFVQVWDRSDLLAPQLILHLKELECHRRCKASNKNPELLHL